MTGYGRLVKYLRPQSARIILGLVLMGFFALFSGFSIAMLYPVFDIVLTPHTPEAIERIQLRVDVSVGEQLSELRHNVLNDCSRALHHEQTFADAGRNMKNDLLDLLRENPGGGVLGWICFIAIFLIFIKTASGYLQK
ncbi:hypothetical protein KKB28_04475, partial [bacterium]|nr:hypothetical protein [bacterium]